MMNSELLRTIADFSKRYRSEMLIDFDRGHLGADWWAALDFFLSRACFQGRRDEVSEAVYKRVRAVLHPIFGRVGSSARLGRLRTRRWAPIQRALDKRIGKGKIGKSRDIDMVLSSLDFVSRLPKLNIVTYSVTRIRKGEIEDLYYDLQRGESPGGIVQVGPKIASFFLRDLVCIYGCEDCVPGRLAFCLQPIDVWVRKIAIHLELAEQGADDDRIREAIVAACRKAGISALQFNQGAWYAGSHAFDLLLERLG